MRRYAHIVQPDVESTAAFERHRDSTPIGPTIPWVKRGDIGGKTGVTREVSRRATTRCEKRGDGLPRAGQPARPPWIAVNEEKGRNLGFCRCPTARPHLGTHLDHFEKPQQRFMRVPGVITSNHRAYG